MEKPHKQRTTAAWSSESVINWLLSEGRLLDTSESLVSQFGQVLHEAGAPIWRFRLSMRTLHPLIAAVTHIWEREAKELQSTAASHGLEQRAGYIGNPLEIIGRTRKPFRKNLVNDLNEDEHPVLHDLRARGATDYFGLPIQFSIKSGGIVVFVTDRHDGFDDGDIERFSKIAKVLAPIIEVYNHRRIADAITAAYLGPRTGQRVLQGQITRGHIEKVEAAILVTDIRNWSGLNQRLGPEKAMKLANACFEIIDRAVTDHNGEILKFIGDGVLAIFPAAGGNNGANDACQNAIKAAEQALGDASKESEHSVQFGAGLHFGEVLYGNIGSQSRLDFTVLGEAVNLAARIESLCGKLEQSLLFSEEVAKRQSEKVLEVSREPLKGFEGEYSIFSLNRPV